MATRAWSDFRHEHPQDPLGRSGAAATPKSRLLGVDLVFHLVRRESIYGGHVNRVDVPDGRIHLSSASRVTEFRDRDSAAGSSKRKDHRVKPRCARCAFRVPGVLRARLCLWSKPSNYTAQHILNLEVEDKSRSIG